MRDDNCIFCKIANGEIPYMRMMISAQFWI